MSNSRRPVSITFPNVNEKSNAGASFITLPDFDFDHHEEGHIPKEPTTITVNSVSNIMPRRNTISASSNKRNTICVPNNEAIYAAAANIQRRRSIFSAAQMIKPTPVIEVETETPIEKVEKVEKKIDIAPPTPPKSPVTPKFNISQPKSFEMLNPFEILNLPNSYEISISLPYLFMDEIEVFTSPSNHTIIITSIVHNIKVTDDNNFNVERKDSKKLFVVHLSNDLKWKNEKGPVNCWIEKGFLKFKLNKSDEMIYGSFDFENFKN